jgi:hypothetical protein
VEKKSKKIQELFDFFLKDFEQDSDPRVIMIPLGEHTQTVQEYRIELPPKLEIYHPFIVFIIFVYLKKFKFFSKEEKVAWTIPIKYKGTPFILTHRKFGFRIISHYEIDEIKSLGIEAMSLINKTIPYAEVLFEPFVKEQVTKGKITLDNQYQAIKSRYLFFRKKAKSAFRKAKTNKVKRETKKKEINGILTEIISTHNSSIKHWAAGNNFATAMLDSYFCLIEHTFVLLLPFLPHVNIEQTDLEAFIGENWKQKLKIVIPLTGDKEALQLFERLDKIKEELRNPLTHGYFLKDGNSFYVHTPNLGAIPMTLTNRNNHLRYGFYSIHNINFENICKCFDDFDKFLRARKSTKFGMLYVEKGLGIAFDNESSKMYQAAMTTVKNFDEFIWYEMMQQDNATNMDW